MQSIDDAATGDLFWQKKKGVEKGLYQKPRESTRSLLRCNVAEPMAACLGAELLIDYPLGNVKSQIAEWSGKEGADVVFDFVGGPNFAASIELVAPYGALVNTVVSDWPAGNNLVAEYKNLSIQFVNIGLPQVSNCRGRRNSGSSSISVTGVGRPT